MSVKLITGPMGANKSSELLIESAHLAGTPLVDEPKRGMNVLIVSPKKDSRTIITNEITTRLEAITVKKGKTKYNGEIDIIKIDSISKLFDLDLKMNSGRKIEVISVDEGQMFDDLELVHEFANKGIKVIIAALNADANMKVFPSIERLRPCDEEIFQFGHCDCGEKASFTILKNKMDSEEGIHFEVGGFDLYSPVCRKCRNKY